MSGNNAGNLGDYEVDHVRLPEENQMIRPDGKQISRFLFCFKIVHLEHSCCCNFFNLRTAVRLIATLDIFVGTFLSEYSK